MALVSFAEMQDVIASAFINAGMIEQEAQQCARIHTESTLDGVNSHGLNRVPRFVDYVRRGWVNLAAKPELVKQLGAIEIYDGGRAPGILNAIFSTERAMQMASQQGGWDRRSPEYDSLDARRSLWLACGGSRVCGDQLDEYRIRYAGLGRS